ncbi:MAG: iron ABC transporter permease [Candidatus Poribacteria bacterium]|nr:iron ABC transporter permease [Candidatus Poribacteria bacterium]
MPSKYNKPIAFAARSVDSSVFLLLLPIVLFFTVFLIYPLLYIFKESFWIGGNFSLSYFKLIVTDGNARELVTNSFKIGIAVTIATTFVSLPLAYFLTRYRFPGRSTLQGVILIPIIMPPFVGAIGMQKFFGLYGSVNMFLTKIGLIEFAEPIDWFGSGFWGVVLLATLHLYPIMYLNVVAALSNVDRSLEEAAENMGASRLKVLRTVTFPLMLPGYFAGAILVFIWAFTDLGTPLILNYNEVIAVQIFRQVTDANVNPMGYALVVLVILLTAIAFYVSKRYTGNKQYAMLGRGHVSTREVQASMRMRLVIYIVVGGIFLIAFLPHISVVLTSLTPDASQWNFSVFPQSYTPKHYETVFTHNDTLPSIKNSLLYSTFSTLLALIFGILISYLLTRKRIPFKNSIDAIAMLPLALPGVALAFGYVGSFADTTLLLRHLPDQIVSKLDPRQNPIALLIISYAVRRLPYMLRSIYAGLQQTSVTFEEASQNLGASPARSLYKITLPLVAANIIAGSILVFSFSMLEVADSLILSMRDQYNPITKAIWNLSQRPVGGAYVASAMGVVGMFILTACLIAAGRFLGNRLGEIFKV